METRLRMLLVLGGLPRPQAQVDIFDADGRFVGRPDLYYEEVRLGIEYDGATHRTSLAEDNRRQNNLLRAGVRLLRFTAADVSNPASLLAHVSAAISTNRGFARSLNPAVS
jgi:very-short-patch-repair endonuclease